MEVTVAITSVRMPARAIITLSTDIPITEFSFPGGMIKVVRDSDGYIESRNYLRSHDWEDSYLRAGESTTVIFPYYADKAPYTVYAEVPVYPGGSAGANLSKADCYPIANAYKGDWYWFSVYRNSAGVWGNSVCPCLGKSYSYGYYYGLQCVYSYYNQIAVEPEQVINDTYMFVPYYGYNQPFWRSPALYTIN